MTTKRKKAMSPEAREKQLISKAVDLAERQLEDGTASPSVITHYLKMASKREEIEREILEKQKELINAKTKNLESGANSEEIYKEALEAMTKYTPAKD